MRYDAAWSGQRTTPMNTPTDNAPQIDAEEILAGILRWVSVESPSNDGDAVNGMVDMVVNRHELRDTLVRIVDMLMSPMAIGRTETLPDAGAAIETLAAYSTGEAALIDGEPPS